MDVKRRFRSILADLPEITLNSILSHYVSIPDLLKWQEACLLKNRAVLTGATNLVFSAPTSAGKSLVGDLLLLRSLIKRGKKGIIVQPYVAIAQERVHSLRPLGTRLGKRIEEFTGNSHPRGGIGHTDVAICTIEKANTMINELILAGKLSDIGILIIDEFHMFADDSRGYLIEMLLTKLLYLKKHSHLVIPQIVAMSGSISKDNLAQFGKWLSAETYHAEVGGHYRPIDLFEMAFTYVKKKPEFIVYKTQEELRMANWVKPETLPTGQLSKWFATSANVHLIYLALQTIASGHSAIAFCFRKSDCEALATTLSKGIARVLGNQFSVPQKYAHTFAELKAKLEAIYSPEKRGQLTEWRQRMKQISPEVDADLLSACDFGVAFHHGNLTFEERAWIERGYRDQLFPIIISCKTLSSGVNLPARRVFIKSSAGLDKVEYTQKVGRAGRLGIDQLGESVLFCKEDELAKIRKTLVYGEFPPIESQLHGRSTEANLARAILEMIYIEKLKTIDEAANYLKCTLGRVYRPGALIEETFAYLTENELIQKSNDSSNFGTTALGDAIIATGFTIAHGLFINATLEVARETLQNDPSQLSILYLINPTITDNRFSYKINWKSYLRLYEGLSKEQRMIANLFGINREFIEKMSSIDNPNDFEKEAELAKHVQFFGSLALKDILDMDVSPESKLSVISDKYGNLKKGDIQSLRQTSATFAGMMSMFAAKLQLPEIQSLMDQWKRKVALGREPHLQELRRIVFLTQSQARHFYEKEITSVKELSQCVTSTVEEILEASAFTNSNQVFVARLGTLLTIPQFAEKVLEEARYLVNIDRIVANEERRGAGNSNKRRRSVLEHSEDD